MPWSHAFFILLSGVGAIVSRSLLIRWRRQRNAQRHGCHSVVQYPSSDPLGRDYDRMIKESFQDGRINDVKMAMYRHCGSSTYEIRSIREHVISTADPDNLHCIAINVRDWKKDVRPGAFPLFGNNLLDQNGLTWKRTRNLIDPLFQRAELKQLEYFRKFVSRFIDLIPPDGSTVDLQPLLRKLCLDSSTELIFGTSIDSLTDRSGKTDALLATFNRAALGVGKRIRPTGFQLLLNNLTGGWDQDWLSDCKTVHDYVDECIVRFRANETSAERGTRYVLIEGMSSAISDPVALRFQLLAIFHMARETAAMGFTNVLFMLARNPHIWAELRSQAKDLGPTDEISYNQLLSLSLFRHTVLEAFRLHNPVARIRRVATRDTVLPHGGGVNGVHPILVPKGTTVWADRYPLTRDPAIWGDDVEEFRPSRFEGRRQNADFQPFFSGPRMCPASQMTIMQCIYLLVRLVREFETIENRDACHEFVEGVVICFTSKNGCRVALRHPIRN